MPILDFISGLLLGFAIGVSLVLIFKMSLRHDDENEAVFDSKNEPKDDHC